VPVRAADPVRGRMKETPSHIEPPALLGPEAPAPMRHEHRHYHIHEFELEQHSPEPNDVPPSPHDSRPHREEQKTSVRSFPPIRSASPRLSSGSAASWRSTIGGARRGLREICLGQRRWSLRQRTALSHSYRYVAQR
jgi:hypothetical protein